MTLYDAIMLIMLLTFVPNVAAITQATTEINRGVDSTPLPGTDVSNRLGEIGLKYIHM